MTNGSLKIRLSCIDPDTGQPRYPELTPPIALGRIFEQMPRSMNGKPVARMVLKDDRVSRYHALIDVNPDGDVILINISANNGTFINGIRKQNCTLNNGDRLGIGRYDIQITIIANIPPTQLQSNQPSIISFDPATGLPNPQAASPSPSHQIFPPEDFWRERQVRLSDLQQQNWFDPSKDEFEYVTIGAGLGSYIWVDYLRIFGAKKHQIIALGTQDNPYAKYKQLCLNSQIPLHERLRSNSDSCPDNIWGWPSYALREAWQDFFKGRIDKTIFYLWQVFAEPTLAETYTPKAGNVFDSIDREAKRIRWSEIFRYGSVRSIRQTNDGRYAIAYSKGGGNYGFIVAKYLYLATGYPAIRFLPHLQNYREQTKDTKLVVNAYENHDHIYQHLSQHGGIVFIQGRGIVASRIIQKLYEVRQRTRKSIDILHLMRKPVLQGSQFGCAQRTVKNHWEFQPFNWPKACWGGDLREVLENADPREREQLIKLWGGTTTAHRYDWEDIIQKGLQEGWYRINFGSVNKVNKDNNRLQVTYQEKEQGRREENVTREADFIIDATGLDAEVSSSPLLNDLVSHYQLPLLNNGRLSVTNAFEVREMRSTSGLTQSKPPGKLYAAGSITLGGPYAAVDSFLGLQYSALRAVDDLARSNPRQLKQLNGWRSLNQWWKWVINQPPN